MPPPQIGFDYVDHSSLSPSNLFSNFTGLREIETDENEHCLEQSEINIIEDSPERDLQSYVIDQSEYQSNQ